VPRPGHPYHSGRLPLLRPAQIEELLARCGILPLAHPGADDLLSPNRPVSQVEPTPDGRLLLTGSAGRLRV
jgi:hypothetical protein